MRLALVACALAVAVLPACRGGAGSASPRQDAASAEIADAATVKAAARYVSAADAFSVEFPFDAAPAHEELAAQEGPAGTIRTASHYVRRGDTAFEVEVVRFPHGSLSPDSVALLQVDRDSAVGGGGVGVLRDSPASFAGPGGAAVPARELELELPGGVRALRRACFFGDRSYVLGAAGPASDPALGDGTFQRFVASFQLEPGS